MNNTKARNSAKADLIKGLNMAGVVEGITLTPEQIQSETRTIMWHGVLRNDLARNKPNYITYNISSSEARVRADDTTYLREVMIAVDIYSKHSFDSKDNYTLLLKVETKLAEKGFEIEMNDEIYENDTKLFHIPLTIYKNY